MRTFGAHLVLHGTIGIFAEIGLVKPAFGKEYWGARVDAGNYSLTLGTVI